MDYILRMPIPRGPFISDLRDDYTIDLINAFMYATMDAPKALPMGGAACDAGTHIFYDRGHIDYSFR